jgi:hypothetical protein
VATHGHPPSAALSVYGSVPFAYSQPWQAYE